MREWEWERKGKDEESEGGRYGQREEKSARREREAGEERRER